MPEGSYLIELAWPQKHWVFYYSDFIQRFGIRWRGVDVQDVRLNWTSYAINVRSGVPVSETERQKVIQSAPISNYDNLWKWADIVVQRNEIVKTLEIVYKE